MEKAIRWLRTAAKLLFVASTATCYYGEKHAIRQQFPGGVPPWADTDWIGIEWMIRGTYLLLLSLAAASAALVLWLARQWRAGWRP
ncbi:MAG TPA: hypothetical protein VGV38_22105 [Pyrinomonadaceae bacterium]|nr:hypothetical protein [Pyrinomonadaceae bacterium]